jgi:predicted RNA-binding Zn-ribbon protein involved in translation (DUF1610 family)
MFILIGRCQKCKKSSDNSVSPCAEVKGINNVYKTTLECEDCGWKGKTEFYSFFSWPDPKEIEKFLRQHEKMYKKFKKKREGQSFKKKVR